MNKQFINDFATILEVNPSIFTPSFNFKSLETWDSLAAMGLIALIDKYFGAQLSSQDIIEINSIQDILNLTENKG